VTRSVTAPGDINLSDATCNELPTDLREPRQTQSHALSPITHGSSSSSPSSLSPLASSLTRSVFHSEFKTWLFGETFSPQTFSSERLCACRCSWACRWIYELYFSPRWHYVC